ncbi:MAG: AraC family transcriptional regulator [Oceanicaulis sp.]
MPDFAIFQLICAVLLLGVAALSIWRGRRDGLGWAWAAFCTSAAASLSLRALGADADGSPAVFLLLAPASATCGVAWLLARALFREERAIMAVHLGVVAVIALVNLTPSGAFGAMLGNLQNLLASTVIVLTLWEAIRGWAAAPARGEKLMRGAYVGVTGLAVLVAVVWLSGPGVAPGLNDAVETTALLAVSLAAGLCMLYRRCHPLAPGKGATAGTPSQRGRPLDPEMRQLAARVDAIVQAEALYLNGDLKVADLARKLQAPEYKVSRAITGALGAANFNQYINRFRIKFAQDLITEDPARSILVVAFDSGFASLGPFNRAFKMMTGQTPRAWRATLNTP